MRSSENPRMRASGIASALLAAMLMVSDGSVSAADPTPGETTCTCPETPQQGPGQRRTSPKYAELKSTLDDSDELAALNAIHLALTEAGDGATYVWQRPERRLSGSVQPTVSFKSGENKICRHLVMTLTAGGYTRVVEGIACRQNDGGWAIEG